MRQEFHRKKSWVILKFLQKDDSMQSIKNYIYEQVAANKLPVNDAAKMLREFHESLNNIEDDIAIIGMSGKFPMARNLDEYWENLENGVDCVSKITYKRKE